MRVFAEYGIIPEESDLFSNDTITQDALENYFNYIIIRIRELTANLDYNRIRAIISATEDEMCDLSGEYNIFSGNSISYRDFVRLECEDNEAYELFHPTVEAGQYHDIEKQFNALGKKLITYFEEKKDAELHPFVSSETGINKKQFTQFAGFVGLKPSMTGKVIPVTITDNFLNGLNSLESYYINACGTKLALTTNHKMTRRSGYLTRKLSLSNIDHYHDDSIEDCGTLHFVVFTVDSDKKLHQIIGRHYYDIEETTDLTDECLIVDKNGVETKVHYKKTNGELKTVYDDSTELIGKTIGLRSPVTCCGHHVCATCYGRELSKINKDANTGLIATLKLTEPLTQRLLSAKHLLSTNTNQIDWNEKSEFPAEYLSVNMDSIYFAEDAGCTIKFLKPKKDEVGYDETENMYMIDKFEISVEGAKKPIEYIAPTDIHFLINPKFLPVEKLKEDDDYITISSANANEDDFIFKYHAKNNELTKSLQEILNLIENTDHLGIDNYNNFVNKFDDLIIENDLGYINSIHLEMIASVLIKDATTGKRLDFSKASLDDYTIDRVSKSVMEGPLATSLAFERINDQLISLDTYEKDAVSIMDNLYY